MSDNTYIDWYMEKRKLRQEIEKQRKEICDKTDEIQKLQNEITDMCHDVFELQAWVKELESSNAELLSTLENECRLCRHGNGNSFNPDCPNGKMCLIHRAIEKYKKGAGRRVKKS